MRERKRWGAWLGAAGAVAAFAFTAGTSHAVNFVVNDTQDAIDASPSDGQCLTRYGTCTLRAAVMQANASAGHDRIDIQPGVYDLLLADPSDGGQHAGDLDIHDSVDLFGASIPQVIIDAGDRSRVFEIHEGVPLVHMEGFTVQEGNAFSEPEQKNTWVAGGGILAGGEELSIDGLLVTRNTAGNGGGITHANRLTIRHSRIHQNTGGTGGGIAQSGQNADLLFEDSVLWGNQSIDQPEWPSARGAGFYGHGTARFERSSVVYNTSAEDGGGLYFEESSGTFTMINTTISHNQAGRSGGAIYNWRSFHARNVTITENYAQNSGSAFYNFGFSQGQWGQTAEFEDSIIFNNVNSGTPSECVGNAVSHGHNAFPAASACGVALMPSDLPAGTDPQLIPIQFMHTHYHPIAWTSPALDAGSAICLAEDQRGVARPQGNHCDMGAYEVEKDADAPIAYDDDYSSSIIGPISIAAPGVLANDIDPNGATLTAEFVGIASSQGTVSLQPGGGFTFTPSGFFQATRTFTYRASNGAHDSNVATVSVTSGHRYEPEVLFEVPEIPWLDPGPYRHECIALWADGTIAAQTFGSGEWSTGARSRKRAGGAQSFEAMLTSPEGGQVFLEGSWDAEEFVAIGASADGKRFEVRGSANAECNALAKEVKQARR